MATKYVFVTGGVVSGLGKGICAASLGRLLKQRGVRVRNQKFDPFSASGSIIILNIGGLLSKKRGFPLRALPLSDRMIPPKTKRR